jgi:hypothetical protein
MMRWNHTIEVITDVETAKAKGQWRIGDALIKDLKDNGYLGNDVQKPWASIDSSVFTDCAAKLAEKGIEHNGQPYSNTYVRDLFQAAYAFPRDERNPKYSWYAHANAGTPKNLKNVAAVLKKLGKTVTKYNVEDVISKWSGDARVEREKEHDAAVAKKEAAKEKKAKASADKLRTKDEAKRAEAEKRRQEAQREFEEAKAAIKESGGKLPYNADFDVDPNDVGALEQMVIFLAITAHITVIKRETKKMLVDVQKAAKVLTAHEQQEVADGVSDITAILDQINDLVNRPKRKVSVIQGGRA